MKMLHEYKIKLKPHNKLVHRKHPIPLKYRKSVDLEMEEMLSAGIIEEAASS